MTDAASTRLAELGITLPEPAAPVAAYVPAVEIGGLLHISGQLPFRADGMLIAGRLGEDFDVEHGRQAAERCGVMLIAQIRAALGGDLSRVERIVKLGAFVASERHFIDQPKVANGASELMVAVFGEAGRHARSAVGVPVLPLGAAVEVDAIVAVRRLDGLIAPAPEPRRVAFLYAQPFAHRGLHGAGLVENSRAAFRAAIAQGHGIECDVQAARGGEAFVFHDDALDRLTGEAGLVADRTAAALDRILLAGTGEALPRLTEMLTLVAGRVPILIEVKARRGAIGPLCLAVRRALEGYRGAAAVMSFNPEVARWFAAHAPRIARGLVVSEGDKAGWRGRIERRLSLWRARPDFLACDVRDLPSRFAATARARGLPVLTWTVRGAALEAVARRHADAMIYEQALSELVARMADGVTAFDPAAWDACAGGDNPFVSHAFLSALEESGSATARRGWQPVPIAIDGADGRLAAVMPAYAKSHSQGEYVFDHAWADAWERAGGKYYPKLQIAVPFSPVPGPRLLTRDPALAPGLIAAAEAVVAQHGLSSAHATFVAEAQVPLFEAAGWLIREDRQFHWANAGYASFDDFLDALASRKRKAIRKERAAAVEGLEIVHLTGTGLTEADWDAFWTFYQDTGARKWGRPYLTRRFFSLLGERMADKVLLMLARRNGRPIAGALNLIGADTLYGRYWGASEEVPFLHFELCYYQAIDAAIAGGLARVEAGAQGSHKLARGYVPVPTWSAHYIPNAGFRAAVADYLAAERHAVEHDIAALAEMAPFKRG